MASSRRAACRTQTTTVVKNRYHRAPIESSASAITGKALLSQRMGRPVRGARLALATALRYIQTRPLGPAEHKEDRALFTAIDDDLSRAAANELLVPLATSVILYHSVVLSPGPRADTFSSQDLQQWTRQVLADLNASREQAPLVWVGAVHRHTRHPHVHVLVGASTHPARGPGAEVRLRRLDFTLLRESGDRWATQITRTQQVLLELETYLNGTTGDMATVLEHIPGGAATGTSTSSMARRAPGDALIDRGADDDDHRQRSLAHSR